MPYHYVLVPFLIGLRTGLTMAGPKGVVQQPLDVRAPVTNGRDKAAGRTHSAAPIPSRPTTVRQHADDEWTGGVTTPIIITSGFKPTGGGLADPFGFASTQIGKVLTKSYAAVQEKVAKNIVTSINKTNSYNQWEGWN